jgi:hypothetical protein
MMGINSIWKAWTKIPNASQFNAMVYTGARPPTSKPVSPTQEPSLQQLGFDSSQDFHVYTIEWAPAIE